MARLGEHKRYAMACWQMNDLVDVGGFHIMRSARFSRDIGGGDLTVLINVIDTFGVSAAQDVRDEIKGMVVRVAAIGRREFVERCFKGQAVDVVFPEFAGALFGVDGEFHGSALEGCLCKR